MKIKLAIILAAVLLGLGALVTVGLIHAARQRAGEGAGALSAVTGSRDARAGHQSSVLAPPTKTAPKPAGPVQALRVHVIWDDSQKPVQGITVTLTSLTARNAEDPVSGVTNAQGQVRLTFPQAWANARLAVRNPEAFPEQRDLTLPSPKEVVLRLKKAGRLFGTVSMAGGRLPVSGAEVLIAYSGEPGGQRTLKVKADGRYEAVSLPPGNVNVAAFLGDFCSTMDQPEGAPATILAGQRTGPLDLVLKPGAAIFGSVREQGSGRPIPGVTIRAEKAPGLIAPPTTTDFRGTYRLGALPVQRVRMTARAVGYIMQGRLVEPSVASQSRCDFTLEPGGEVEIRVADAAGKPIPQVQIGVWDWAGQYPGLSAETNGKGIALLQGVSILAPPDLILRKVGYEQPPSARPLFRPGQSRTRLDFVLKEARKGKGAFAGRVTDEKGMPLAGITIVWGQPENPSDESATSGADGAYRLDVNLERPDQRLTAFGKGWATQGRAGLSPGKPEKPQTADFSMKAGHWLAGQVVNQQASPLPAMNVTLNPQAADAGNLTAAQRTMQTDPDGRFRAEDLPDGLVQVTASDAAAKLSETTTTLVDREVRIVVKSPGVILGRLTDKTTHKPIRDFNVKASGGGIWWGDRAMNGQTFSSADGRFKLIDLRQGELYGLTIEAAGYATKSVKDILADAAGAARENLIELSGGTRIQGVLLDKATGIPVADAQVVYGIAPAGAAPDWDAVERGGGWGLRVLERRTTQVDGTFSLNVEEDQGTLFILPKSLRRLAIPAAERAKYQVGDQLVIHLSSGASLAGQVILDGAPAMAASMQLTALNEASGDQSAMGNQRTDNQGAFAWESLDPGAYELTVQTHQSPPVYPCLARRCTLKEAEQKTLNLGDDLGAASLGGAVLDHGKPVAGAVVTLRPLFDWDYTLLASHSDEEGIYLIQGLRPGRYKAQLSGPTGQRAEETVEVRGQEQHDFEFQLGHALTARLVFDPGFPPDLRARLQSASLQAKEFARSLTGEEGIDGRATSKILGQGDQIRFEGRFLGQYTISLEFGGQPDGSSISLTGALEIDTLKADQDLGELPVAATGSLRVRLVYGGGQATPARRASQLTLFLESADTEAGLGTQLNLDPARPEQTVGPIGVGTHKLWLFAFGYHAEPVSPTVAIEPGKAAGPLTFTLTPEGMIMGLTMEKPASGASPAKMILAGRITLSGPGVRRTLVPKGSPNVDIGAMLGEARTGKDWAAGPAFVFRDLKQGSYQLTLEAPGYQALTLPVEATPGQLNPSPMLLTPLGRK